MNTFKKPISFVFIFLVIGFLIAILGKEIDEVGLVWGGAIIEGVGLGIAIVNGFPYLFLDKNTTDKTWNEKFGNMKL